MNANPFENLLVAAPAIEAKLGYSFRDRQYLILAFVHRSFANEHRDVKQHNERLEFLGDSVLGLLIAEYLYKQLPSTAEGDLSYLRSRLVEASCCMNLFLKLQLEEYVLLGKGEKRNDGKGRESIYADLFEALIGAIYLDGGIEAARHFLFSNFQSDIEAIMKMPLSNWKAILQDYCQRNYQKPPIYQVLDEFGPDHSKTFNIVVLIDGLELGHGSGASKKEAQQAAAANAMSHLQVEKSDARGPQ